MVGRRQTKVTFLFLSSILPVLAHCTFCNSFGVRGGHEALFGEIRRAYGDDDGDGDDDDDLFSFGDFSLESNEGNAAFTDFGGEGENSDGLFLGDFLNTFQNEVQSMRQEMEAESRRSFQLLQNEVELLKKEQSPEDPDSQPEEVIPRLANAAVADFVVGEADEGNDSVVEKLQPQSDRVPAAEEMELTTDESNSKLKTKKKKGQDRRRKKKAKKNIQMEASVSSVAAAGKKPKTKKKRRLSVLGQATISSRKEGIQTVEAKQVLAEELAGWQEEESRLQQTKSKTFLLGAALVVLCGGVTFVLGLILKYVE